MKPEAQRIAIAEACGWTEIRQSTRWEVTDPPEAPIVLCGRINDVCGHVPDYLNDLNAMHEAEKVLTGEMHQCYMDELYDAANQDGHRAHYSLWHATAAQRAEAFLRTIGRWEDGK